MQMEVGDLLGLSGVVRHPDGYHVLVGEEPDEVASQGRGQRTV
jgi:hypothetical protein